MKKQLSVIIPTLQKDINTLNNLVSILVTDEVVNEVIVIDNSLKGYIFDNEKVKVIIPDKNLFVNPSWNMFGPLGALISTMDVKALILVLVLIVIDILIYLPFFKVYEKQKIAEESLEA